MSGLAAKVTEDNLRAFEDQLEKSRSEPLSIAIRGIVGLMFDTYLGNVRISRADRGARARAPCRAPINLMPTLAESQNAFAAVLANALRQRDDVRKEDLDVVAFVVTNMAMGVVHTSVWSEKPPFGDTDLRVQMTRACLRFLTSEPRKDDRKRGRGPDHLDTDWLTPG